MQSPRIAMLHQNNGTACDASIFNALYSSINQHLFEKNLCNQSSHYENYGWFLLWIQAIKCVLQNWHFSSWEKMNGTHKRALVSPRRLHFMTSSASKDTSQAEMTSSSEKIKLVSFAIVELHWSEGIREADS